MIFFFLFLLLLLWWWWWSFPFVFLCGVGGYLCIQDGCQLQAVAASHWCRLEDSLAMQKLLDAVHSTYSSLLPPYPPPPPLYSSSSPSPSPSRLLHEKSSLEEGQGEEANVTMTAIRFLSFFFPFLFWSFWSFWTVLTFLSPSLASTPSPTPLWLCFKTKTPNKLDNKTKNPQKLEDWNEPFSFYIYIYLRNLKQRKTKKQRKETIIIKHFTQVPCRILLDSKRVHSTPESRSLLIVAIVIIIIITFPMIEYWLDVWEGGRRRRRRRRKRRIERIQSSMRMFQRMFQRMSDVPCLPHLPFFLLKIVKKKERIRSQLFVSHRTLWKEMKNERLKNKNCYL